LNIPTPIISVEGTLQAEGVDSFSFVSKDGEYPFRFKDDSDARLIMDRMKQNGYNLAYVSPVKNGAAEFDLHVTFFYTAKIDKKTNVILDEKIKETLKRKGLVSNRPEEFENKHILLVDDIITTGATTENCYHALRSVDNLKISVAALAVTSH
jgi:predicted amidophosphoribosyltransferase